MVVQVLRITTVLGVLALAAAAQAPPPQPATKPASEQEKTKPAKKAKRVWTDDDLKGLRKPSDEASAEKQPPAEEAGKPAEASDKDKVAKPGEEASPEVQFDPDTGKPYEDPNAPATMEKMLKDLEGSIQRTQDLVEQAHKEMASAPDDAHYDVAKEKADAYEADIETMQKQAQDLRARLETAKKQKPAAKPKAAPAAPAPPQP